MSGYNKKNIAFCLKICFIFSNSLDADEMQHYAAFHLGLAVCLMFGMYCICLTNVQRSNRNEACNRILNNWFLLQKARVIRTSDMEIRIIITLLNVINCAEGIIFRLVSVLIAY